MAKPRDLSSPHKGPGRRRRLGITTRPTIQFINPNWGPVTGGTAVTITGRNFTSAVSILFDGNPATSVVVVSPYVLTCVTPAGAEGGLVDVVVANGSESSTFVRGFTYSATRVVSVTPQSGILPGAVTVLLYGYNFVNGSTVTVGGVAATDVTFYDSQHLGFTTPSSTETGFRDIVITDPFGAMTTVRNGFQYITLARYSDIRRDPGIQIEDTLNNSPNTASLTIDGQGARPQTGESIVIVDSFDGNRKLFAGTVLTSVQDYDDQTDQVRWAVTATDFTWLFNRRRPFGTYVLTPADEIVRDLVGRFAPSFTVAHVQTKLARITIQFDGSKDLATALSDIASAIGGGHWYVDYDQDVHFFHQIPPEVLAVTKPSTVVQDSSPAGGSRMTVTTSTTPTTFTPLSGLFWFFASTFVYDDGVESALSLFTLYVGAGTQATGLDYSALYTKTKFDNVPIGAAIGSHNVVARNIYAVLAGQFDDTGVRLPLYRAQFFCRVNDNVTTTFECASGGVDASVASVQGSQAAGITRETFYKQVPQAAAPAYDAPDNAPTASENTSLQQQFIQPEINNANDPNSNIRYAGPGSQSFGTGFVFQFKIVNLYADMTLSQLGPGSNILAFPNGLQNTIELDNIPIGQDLNSVPVIARVVMGAWSLDMWDDAAWADPSKVVIWYLIPDNTSTDYSVSEDRPFQLGDGTVPTVGGGGDNSVPVWPNDDGPSLEDDDPPEDIDADNQTLTRDTPFQYTVDLSQVRNRVYVTGAATALTADASSNDDILVVADCSMFASGQGKLYVNGEILDFAGTSARSGPGTVFLSQPLQNDAPNGTGVALFAMVEDLDSQRILGLLEKDKDGNSTDGIHEYVVQDTSLRSPAELVIRAHAEIELFANPIGTIRYSTRDPKTKSGSTVHVDLTDPPCVGDFLIQSVSISQVRDESDDLDPLYTVSASSVKYQLEDLLLAILRTNTQNASGGASSVSLAGFQDIVNNTFNSKATGFDPTRKSLAWLQVASPGAAALNPPSQFGVAGCSASLTGGSPVYAPTNNDDPETIGLNNLGRTDASFWAYPQASGTNGVSGIRMSTAGIWIENNVDFTFVVRMGYAAMLAGSLIWVGFCSTGGVPTSIAPAATIDFFGVRKNPGEGGWRGQFTTSEGVTPYYYYTDDIVPCNPVTTYVIRIQSAYSPSQVQGHTVTFSISTQTQGGIALQGTKTIKYADTTSTTNSSKKAMPILDANHGNHNLMSPFVGICNKDSTINLRWFKFSRIVGVWDAWENY